MQLTKRMAKITTVNIHGKNHHTHRENTRKLTTVGVRNCPSIEGTPRPKGEMWGSQDGQNRQTVV